LGRSQLSKSNNADEENSDAFETASMSSRVRKKSLYFKGKILYLDKKINSSLPFNKKILIFKRRKIDLAKHFSKRSNHC